MNSRATGRAGKLLYLAGPGDVVRSFEDWRAGIETPSETTRTYSGEAFRYCVATARHGVFIASHPRAAIVRDGDFVVENRPKPAWRRASGVWYHLRDLVYGLGLLKTAFLVRPRVVIMDSGTTHWPVLILFRLLTGARVYATFHNAYHPMRHPYRGWRGRIFSAVDGFTFRFFVDGCLAASEECRRQYLTLSRGSGRAEVFNGLFDADAFRVSSIMEHLSIGRNRPPVILFAGRIEPAKGVFDLLQACERLFASGSPPFELVFCGDGSELAQLRERVTQSPICSLVTVHGRLGRTRLLEQYRRAHVVVVPTRTGFAEGFAMVCAEAVVCGVPVVASDVVPAAEMLAAAVLTFPAENVEALHECLGLMLRDAMLHERLKAACTGLASQFFDPGRGLAAAMMKLVGTP